MLGRGGYRQDQMPDVTGGQTQVGPYRGACRRSHLTHASSPARGAFVFCAGALAWYPYRKDATLWKRCSSCFTSAKHE
ncbi:hypothetical protein GCM10009016_21340 [Halomonas beimenensis]